MIRNIEILLVTLLLFDLGQNNLNVFDKFGMVVRFLATFAADVSAQVSFNKATKGLEVKIPVKFAFLRLLS